MPATEDKLRRIDEAMARLDQALEAVRRIPCEGRETVAIDGIVHELGGLAERLQVLRHGVAGEGP